MKQKSELRNTMNKMRNATECINNCTWTEQKNLSIQKGDFKIYLQRKKRKRINRNEERLWN